jgi:CRP/FNR family transcriptional regulator
MDGGFLGALPAGVRDLLSRETQRLTYAGGDVIRDPGAPVRPGILLEGSARDYVAAADGREATVRYVRPGDPIGMAGPFVRNSNLGLQALEPTTVLYFDARQFEHQIATDVALSRAVALHLARGFAKSSDAVSAFAFGDVRQRVAAHLIHLATRDRHGRLVARVTQQGLADAVGSVRAVVARALAQFRNAGLVLTSHGAVVIMDEEGLRDEAELV